MTTNTPAADVESGNQFVIERADAFWRWSLSVYDYPDAAPALIALQDDAGLNVNVALWCCWTAKAVGDIPEAAIRQAAGAIAPVNERLTRPVREARRALSTVAGDRDEEGSGGPVAPYDFTEEVRTRLKSAELAIERLEQFALAANSGFVGEPGSVADPGTAEISLDAARGAARRNIAAYARLAAAQKRRGFSVSLIERAVAAIFPERGPVDAAR